MAKTPKNSKNPFAFKPIILDQEKHQKRRVVKHLPTVHQGETLQKFFGATADHLFDSGTAKPINGFVGQRPLWHNPEQDYYLSEPSSERDFYQLETAMVSKDTEGNVTNLLFYPDLIDHIRFQGGITNNQHRMFEQDVYTWCPPIDIDKILNFRQYAWLSVSDLRNLDPADAMSIPVYGPTRSCEADGSQFVFFLPGQTDDLETVNPADFYDLTVTKKKHLLVHVNGTPVSFNYNGATSSTAGEDFITFNTPPARGSTVQIWVYSDFENNVLGETTVHPNALGGQALSSGMRIRIMMDKNTDFKPAQVYIVEGVGRSIRLVAETASSLSPLEANRKDYMVMRRGAANNNPWSNRNRWFHISTLTDKFDEDYLFERRAVRPIIEFSANLELFNYGLRRRPHVDVVVDAKKLGISNVLGHIGATPGHVVFDGVTIAAAANGKVMIEGQLHGQGARILVTNSEDVLNNKIFALVNQQGSLSIVLETDSVDPNGDPTFGDLVNVLYGSEAGNEFNWNGTSWVKSQKKTGVNQYPLFMLYDMNGVELTDPTVYPGSSFKGSRIFSYQESLDESTTRDLAIGLRLVHDNKGDFTFENYLETGRYDFDLENVVTPIEGFYFYRNINLTNGVDELGNSWFKAPATSKQFVVDRFLPKAGERLFEISQLPIDGKDNLQVWRGRVDDSSNFGRQRLVEDVDFIRNNQNVLVTDVRENDIIEIKTFNPANPPEDMNGFYEVPASLQANPDCENVTTISKGDFYSHFSEIISQQVGFVGAEYAINNYRDTARSTTLGTHIIQNGAPLLKTMLLASDANLDIVRATRFVESEYSRFKDKFQQKILTFSQTRKFTTTSDQNKWIDEALREINLGKTKSFPFYNSKVGLRTGVSTPTFIPSTPSSIGIYPIYEPTIYPALDAVDTNDNTTFFVRGHDGSWTRAFSRDCAEILLALEDRIIMSIPANIKERARPVYDWQSVYGDGLRSSQYSYAEYLQLLQPSFERWTATKGENYRANEIFVTNDEWTYNWSSVPAFDGSKLPGHWRGIYEKFYGTARPDLAPWEMLGFTVQPSWWSSRYGPGPYTSDNTVLWNDIERGLIYDGDRKGIHQAWARPGIKSIIPVDEVGELLNPYQAGVATTLPPIHTADADWAWGDNGPIEQQWRRSVEFPFACAIAAYLMKPSVFVELGWDTENLVKLFPGESREQWMNSVTMNRPRSSELLVHGEGVDTLTPTVRVGVQQWVSDLLVSRNSNVTNTFGNIVRGLGAQLAYKVAGFADSDTLVVSSDAFGRLPAEDVSINLYRSPSIQEESYSGVAIEWTGSKFKAYGYDPINPRFNTLPGDSTGAQIKIGGTGRGDLSPAWRAGVYYGVNITVAYGKKFYRCVKTHTAASVFENEFWQEVARPQYADGSSLVWFQDAQEPLTVVTAQYGDSFSSPQEIANLINGYDRYLKSRGWVFDDVNDINSINDWQEALKAFIIWSQNDDLKAGDVIALSPGSNSIKFIAEHGTIQPVEQIVNGAYSVVDQLGQPIEAADTVVVRHDAEMRVTSNGKNAAIYGLRLYVSELEHVVVFNNKTIFGDTIYNPLLNIRQPRLRIQGFKTIAWTGRVDAPGFIITGTTITPNFERAADDFRRFFDIEAIENKSMQDRARANFGYQEREYLNNLLLGPTNQFEFYQGMIQQKGSPTSMRRLLRSSFIRHNKGLQLFEEWAFRVGDYGGSETQPSMELSVAQKDFKHNPQMFEFNTIFAGQSNNSVDVPGVTKITDVISSDNAIAALDPRWAWRPDNLHINWPVRTSESDTSRDLPTAGFVNLDEVRWTAPRKADWDNLVRKQSVAGGPYVLEGDRVWYYGIDDLNEEWKTAKYYNTDFAVDGLSPTLDQSGTIVFFGDDRVINEEGIGAVITATGTTDPSKFYISLSSDFRTDGIFIEPEHVVIEGVTGNDDFNGRLYTPKFAGSVFTELNPFKNNAAIVGLYEPAGTHVRKITVEVTEAFAVGSILEVGTDLYTDEFIKSPLVSVGLDKVDLTVVGTTVFDSASFPTTYPYKSSEDRGIEVRANLFTTDVNGSVKITVDYFHTSGFEVQEQVNGIYIPVSMQGVGNAGSIFTWIPTLYANINAGTIPDDVWNNGDLIEVKTLTTAQGGNDGWAVMKYSAGDWLPIRVQNRKIDSDIMTNAAIYDSGANELRMVLQLYDPAKGFIPGVADRELHYKLKKDPAIYGSTTVLSESNLWGAEQAGRLWWDLSTVRYLDYEIYDDLDGGVDYRWKHWGRIAPGSNVDVYEWVRSPVLPSGYADLVAKQKNSKNVQFTGYVLNPENARYVERLEWNDSINRDETIYYFWVLNVTIAPTLKSRKLSATQVTNVLANPVNNDIPYFAAIDHSKIILGGIKQFVADEDTILKVKWKTSPDAETPHHKQWTLLREHDPRNTLDDALWNKMRDSLVGWDNFTTDDGVLEPKIVPDDNLPRPQQVGNLVRPRQSWFPSDVYRDDAFWPSRNARESMVDTFNDIVSREAFTQLWFDWQDVFGVGETLPDTSQYVTTALDLADLALMVQPTVNAVQPGEKVLIENTSQVSGFWTLWECVETAGVRSFVLSDFQKWKMQEDMIWNRVDWFAKDWSPSDFPTYRFANLQERDNSRPTDYQLLKGTLVQVDNLEGDDGIWTWYVLNSKGYTQVARKNGTLKLTKVFSDPSRTLLDPAGVKALLNQDITPETISTVLAPVIVNRDGSMELEWLLNNLRTRLLDTLQKNELFFAMVKSAFKANRTVDWAFKTSFLYLGGYAEDLRQSPVAFKDQIDNVVAYLEEVKPFHVKIREYVRRLSYGPDVARLTITDFDKPVYVDRTATVAVPRKLDITNADDAVILKNNVPWKFWYENYQKTNYDIDKWDKEWNPIRRVRTRILLDRVSCSSIRGWDTSPWDAPLSLYSQTVSDVQTINELSAKYRAEFLWDDAVGAPDLSKPHQAHYFAGPNRFGDCAVSTHAERDPGLMKTGKVTAGNQGTIVVVRADDTRWMWTGKVWVKFDAVGWDQDLASGAAGRVDRFYNPLPGMEPRGTPGLIEGCDFDGTLITSTFQDGAWDMFEWDSAGWSSELRDRVGSDPDLIKDTGAPEEDSDIRIVGNKFAQPGVNGKYAAEQMFFTGKDYLNITVMKKTNGVEAPLMRATKSQIDGWKIQPLTASDASVNNWDQVAKKLTINVPAALFPFHDPNNPTKEYLDKCKLMMGYASKTSNTMTLGAKTFDILDLDGKAMTAIPRGLIGTGIRVVLENANKPAERMIGTVSSVTQGLELALWDGSLDVTITGYVGTPPATPSNAVTKWNIIPLDLFADKGQIWVGQAKFTYSSVEEGDSPTKFILNNAHVDGQSLAGVVVSNDNASVSLPINAPIYNAFDYDVPPPTASITVDSTIILGDSTSITGDRV